MDNQMVIPRKPSTLHLGKDLDWSASASPYSVLVFTCTGFDIRGRGNRFHRYCTFMAMTVIDNRYPVHEEYKRSEWYWLWNLQSHEICIPALGSWSSGHGIQLNSKSIECKYPTVPFINFFSVFDRLRGSRYFWRVQRIIHPSSFWELPNKFCSGGI